MPLKKTTPNQSDEEPPERSAEGGASASSPGAPASVGGSSLDEEKENALSLFDKQGTKGKRDRSLEPRSDIHSFLPPISKFLEEDKPVEPEPVPPSVPGEEARDPAIIHIKPPIIVRDLAERMGIKPFKIMKDLMAMDVFANPDSAIDPEAAAKICEAHGFIFEKEKREKGAGVHKPEEIVEEPPPPVVVAEDALRPRAPIITFMGHVDHGKTSLLDAIRKSRVTVGEAGGITQHISAYSVVHNGHPITFIDTPGHQAFTEMRARGANVTDIVVLVVAADDGLMPTTLEAISHARAAGVTLLVAINKIDLPSANVDRVKTQLQENDLTPEDWGGHTICVETSATTGLGVDDLLEMIHLQAEVLELRANPQGPARAIVIEASSKAGRGSTASVIVETGTLRVGRPFICGPFYGKVKALVDDRGRTVEEAGPAMPVELLGFNGLPHVGDEVVEMESERDAKRLSEERQQELRLRKLVAPQRSTLESFFSDMEEGAKKILKVVLKTDVQGSIEAIRGALDEIKSEKINLSIIHAAAGPVSESDVLLASASDAVIVGFNVKVESKALLTVKKEGVQIKLFSIIYELLDQIREALVGMLDPETREKIIGHAEVKEIFKVHRGFAAGCLITDGKIERKARARVLRGKQAVFDGGLATLRRFQDEVKEVKTGMECGIRLGDFNEYKVGDVIECYLLEKVATEL